jgi:hypothetical protein
MLIEVHGPMPVGLKVHVIYITLAATISLPWTLKTTKPKSPNNTPNIFKKQQFA